MIKLNGVSKSFDLQESKTPKTLQVLQDISLNVDKGEILSVIGPSGCGKTTLLRIIAGLETKTEGTITIEDQEVTGPGPDRGLVFQAFNLFPWMTARENIEFGLLDLPKEERDDRVKRYIDLVGLSGFEDYHPHKLSGGMQQRAGIARALAIEPKVLLLDEPLANVDSQSAEVLLGEFLKIFAATGKTVIYVTHDMDEAIYISDRIAVLSSRPGRLLGITDDTLPKPRWQSDIRLMKEFGLLRTELWKSLKVEKSR